MCIEIENFFFLSSQPMMGTSEDADRIRLFVNIYGLISILLLVGITYFERYKPFYTYSRVVPLTRFTFPKKNRISIENLWVTSIHLRSRFHVRTYAFNF